MLGHDLQCSKRTLAYVHKFYICFSDFSTEKPCRKIYKEHLYGREKEKNKTLNIEPNKECPSWKQPLTQTLLPPRASWGEVKISSLWNLVIRHVRTAQSCTRGWMFRLDIKMYFLVERVVKQWNSFLERWLMPQASTTPFRRHLDKVINIL